MSTTPFKDELIATVRAIAQPGKGILAADESTGTIGKRFEKIKLENTEANRRDYRELLFRTPGDVGKFISGVIMYEETLFQKAVDGTPLVKLLTDQGIVPGIKVDKGLVDIPGTQGEQLTIGLEGLAARCDKYYAGGARFAKWRAVIKIANHGKDCPSQLAIDEVAYGLSRYAQVCQWHGLAPIVEPEVLMDGDHSIEVCGEVTERVVQAVVAQLQKVNIVWEGMLLKPNMVTAGSDHAPATAEQIGLATVRALARSLPAAVPSVNFLSGGQSEPEASANLNAINRVAAYPRPWNLSFSYGRALQQSVIATWNGKPENVAAAQKAFYVRAYLNSLATLGKYEPALESQADLSEAARAAASASTFVRNYAY